MPPNWLRSNGCGSGVVELEEVARVERVVAEELVGLAAELIGARSRDEVDDRARDVAELRAERRVVDLEFLDARDRRRKTDRSERQVVRASRR